jgi:cell wall-associated NlpC family hydrolase
VRCADLFGHYAVFGARVATSSGSRVPEQGTDAGSPPEGAETISTRDEGERVFRKFVIMVSTALTFLAFSVMPAQASASHRTKLRVLAYDYAVSQAGKMYCWGGTGPSCYDCSGLLYMAYQGEGLWIGRTTYDMLDNRRLVRIKASQARRGDLAFFGTGHVMMVDRANIVFGATTYGQRIGWLRTNSVWHPTAYYRIRGAAAERF